MSALFAGPAIIENKAGSATKSTVFGPKKRVIN